MKVYAGFNEKEGSYFIWSPSYLLVKEFIDQNHGWIIRKYSMKNLMKYIKNDFFIYDLDDMELTVYHSNVVPRFQLSMLEEIESKIEFDYQSAIGLLKSLLDKNKMSDKDKKSLKTAIKLLESEISSLKSEKIDQKMINDMISEKEYYYQRFIE